MLASLSPLEIQAAYQAMIDRNLSAKTIRYAHSVLRAAIRQAIRWQLLLADPTQGVQLPSPQCREMSVLTTEQARTFLKSVDLIFVTEFGRPVNVNSLVYKHFKPILKKATLPNIRLYDLRHTAATLALTVGVSPKVVSEQLGHTSAAFTLDVYSHVLPHMQDDAAAKVESALLG
jgi:integrase